MAAIENECNLPSRRFQPRVYGVGAWTDHLHFGYDVVAELKPKVLVELGTDRGESYFCFCQSVAEHKMETRCFAIDTWEGDSQAGGYDETTWEEVKEHNEQHYREFSTLLRSTFDNAVERFADESIDLLHLDGLHTEEAVRRDVENWLPKLRRGGILLLHDVAVRKRGFGVWKVWSELSSEGQAFTFEIGPGLGVWQKGKEPATPLLRALFDAPNESSAALLVYYRKQAARLQQTIAQQWRDRSIRETPFARQTVIQVFHCRDGSHREEDSVYARIGHGTWKNVQIRLPDDAGAAPLRIDFVSAFTTIDLAGIEVRSAAGLHFSAEDCVTLQALAVAGDVERQPHESYLRLKITGPDPQLHLPVVHLPSKAEQIEVRVRVRVSAGELSAA